MTLRFAGAVALALAAPLVSSQAQSRFATSVVDYSPGSGGGVFVGANALGGPQGGGFGTGSFHVASLGVGGSLTLGFDVTIVDGPGADLIVSENAFLAGLDSFAEVAFVEVSTDGVNFARFPNAYAGPAGPLAAFGASPMGTFAGMSGGLPVLANVLTNTLSPFDPIEGGGEAFDLAELATHPSVVGGLVDLADIHQVRLVDVPEGAATDSQGTTIWDHGGATSSADIDSVAVIHHSTNQTSTQPTVDLFLDASGFLHWILADPDGLGDLDPTSLKSTFNYVNVPFNVLFPAFSVIGGGANSVELRSKTPIPGSGLLIMMAVSVSDLGGEKSVDQIMLQG